MCESSPTHEGSLKLVFLLIKEKFQLIIAKICDFSALNTNKQDISTILYSKNSLYAAKVLSWVSAKCRAESRPKGS
jgi:hypothetical protein